MPQLFMDLAEEISAARLTATVMTFVADMLKKLLAQSLAQPEAYDLDLRDGSGCADGRLRIFNLNITPEASLGQADKRLQWV